MEGKQHTQSIIAKLMGLEELPPKLPFPSNKTRRVLSENYLQKTASIGLREKSSILVVHSTRINTQKQQEVVKVFETQLQHTYSHEMASQSAAKSKMQEHTYSFVKESDKSDGISGDLVSDNGDLPRYLQQVYGLSTKHDHQVSRLRCDPVHLSVFSGPSYENVSKTASMSSRTTFGETMRSFSKMETGSPVGKFGEFGIDCMKKIEFHYEPYEKIRHTNIIVLGPSSGKSDNTKNHLFSLRYDVKMEYVNSEYKEFTRTENGIVDDEEADGEGVVSSVDSLGNSSRVPRAISQKTSHSVWDKVNHSSKSIPRELKVNESSLRAVALTLPSSSSLNNTRKDGFLHFFANRSFLPKESKKQTFKRWKLTNACQETEVGCRSHTPGEMCAVNELETRKQNLDAKHGKHCFMHISRSGSCSPFCISGTDGSKYEHSRISPLDSRVACGSPKNRIGNEASKHGWHLRKKEIVDEEDSKPSNLMQKAGLECRELSFGLDQSSDSISPCISSVYGKPEEVNKMIDDEKEIMLEKDSLYRGKIASEVPHCSNISPGNTMANANTGNIRSSSRITDEVQSEPNLCHSYIEDGNTSIISVGQESWNDAPEIGTFSTKHTMVDPKFPQNLRETNQTSPSSVLEPPFKEEKFCVSEMNYRHADLCSVAMQLELLDTNSEELYSEGSEMAVSSDDVSERASLDLCQENKMILLDFNTEESRDYSYIVDVLDEVNFHDMNFTMDYNIWNSSECPVNSLVFDVLEKKYGKQRSWPKSDRKLLFDCINSGLSEILHSFIDIYTMEKSLKRRYHLRLRRNEVEEELWKLLMSLKKEVRKDLSEKALGNGTRWLKVEEEIGTICGVIECFLFEELAAELAYY